MDDAGLSELAQYELAARIRGVRPTAEQLAQFDAVGGVDGNVESAAAPLVEGQASRQRDEGRLRQCPEFVPRFIFHATASRFRTRCTPAPALCSDSRSGAAGGIAAVAG